MSRTWSRAARAKPKPEDKRASSSAACPRSRKTCGIRGSGDGWMSSLRDVRYAIRSLIKSWGFALGAGAVLALAIGATIAIFSVVNAVLLQPLAYPDAERIVSVETFWTNTGRASQDVSGPDFLDWQAQSNVFEKMAVSFSNTDEAIIVGDGAVFGNGGYVSADFFAVFSQSPSAGRLLTEHDVPSDDAEPTAAVVAYHWAVAQFGSNEAAIGKTITVYGNAMEIVGVAAPGFRYPGATDIWAPMRPTNHAPNRNDHPYQAVGKLKGDVDLTRAQAQMRTIGDTLARQYPENRLKSSDGDSAAGAADRQPPGDVVGADECRGRRLAHRVRQYREPSAGAGRGQDARDCAPRRARRRPGRVVRQLLTESFVLAGVAGLAGLLLASMFVQALAALSPANLPRIDDVRMDIDRPPVRARALAGVDGALGLVPALHASRLDLSDALKQGGSKATASRAEHPVPLGPGRGRSGVVGDPAGRPQDCCCDCSRRSSTSISGSRRTVCWWPTRNMRSGTASRRTSGLEAGSMQMCSIVCAPCPGSVLRRASPSSGWDESPDHLATFTLRPAGGTTGGTATSRVPRDHGGLLQDAGDSDSCRARFRVDRHAGAAAGRHHQRDPGTHRLPRGVAHWTAHSDGDEYQRALDGDCRDCWRHPLAGPESTERSR